MATTTATIATAAMPTKSAVKDPSPTFTAGEGVTVGVLVKVEVGGGVSGGAV